MTLVARRPGTVLIFTIHRTDAWWRVVGDHLGFERAVTITDHRGHGDYNTIDAFYPAYRRFYRDATGASLELTADEVSDVIARCRVLRWLPARKARAMVLAMAEAEAAVLDAVRPRVVVAFPIDRYTSDVLARLSRKRGIPFYELTASALPKMAMLMFRGRLVAREEKAPAALVEEKRAEIADPLFTPSYVNNQTAYSLKRWFKVFGRFRLRGWVFRALSLWHRDPLNLHYTDAQSFLGHKPSLGDRDILTLVDEDWQERVAAFAPDRRVFVPLQLFPEASIDYWVEDLGLVDYEAMLIEATQALSAAGYQVIVKDHPLQFGFRQRGLIRALKAIPNVVMVPYDVSGNRLTDVVDTTFNLTGTLGLQSAMLGRKSIVAENYYTVPGDFIEIGGRSEVGKLAEKIAATPLPADLKSRQTRIVANLMRGSFAADFFSFQGFGPESPIAPAAELGQRLGEQIALLGPDGEDWHRKSGL
ncbi:hypothetical protein [Sphingopyxis sp.]|uniref:capsular polysaccharide export protein, LipB/KpsS family n=1 Tax=Sphingopyxis sp. TaxID=1908224 RepID=UPI003BAA7FB5